MKKKISIFLLVIMILPIFFILKPVLAVDSPQLNATVAVKGNKQVYTIEWEVPGGKYWAKTPDKTYAILYRIAGSSEWKPVTVGNSARIAQTTSIKGKTTFNVKEADYGKSFQFSLTDSTSIQSNDTIVDSRTIVPTTSIQSKTVEEVTAASPTDDPEQFWGPDDKGNIFERIVALLVYVPVKVVEYVGEMASFRSIEELVFLTDLSESDRERLPWNDEDTKNKIHQWFLWLMWATSPLYVFVIAYNGFKIMYSASNPMARAEAMDSIQRWFFSIGIVIFAPIFLALLMTISGVLVDGIVYAYQGITGGGSMDPIADITDISTGSILGTALVKAMFALLYLYFNAIYIIRMTAISVMFAFTPILAMIWAVRKDTPAMAVWMGELASNAVMPVAHGLVICTILLLCQNIAEGSWVYILIMMYCLIPLSEALRNSLTSIWTRAAGMNESKIAGNITSMAGLGGVLSMMRVGKASFGGGGVGAATSIGKSNLNPQRMSNLTRNISAKAPPGTQSGMFDSIKNKFNQQDTPAPNTNFKKTDYIRHNGKSIYAKHNWDHKTPKPTAVRKPQMSATPKSYYYKPPEPNRHMSGVVQKAIPTAAKAGMWMSAPMIAMAGAVPGGAGMAAGVYAATAGVARGGMTAAGIGHNLYQARKDAGGNTGQALKTVTGADTKRGAAWSVAKTVGGSVVKPTATHNNAVRMSNLAGQEKREQMAARKAKLDARLNPINSGKARDYQTSNANRNNQGSNTQQNNATKGVRINRKTTAPRREYTVEQLKNYKRHSTKYKFK